jgi:predicted dehydrogenase
MDPGPVELVLVGAGHRGAEVYAEYCLHHPGEARVVAVADPRPDRRAWVATRHAIPDSRCFERPEELFAAPKLADGVIIATPDRTHVDPAILAIEAGYDVLLEKPVSPERHQIERLRTTASSRPDAVTVAHVLRYTPFFTTIRRLLDDGAIGRLQGIEHTENIGFWHFAHSYVRGNWARSDASSPMILAKACHDLDLLRWLAGAPCEAVASFGERRHFRAEQAPDGAPDRCLDGCPIETSCPYHAGRFYLDQLGGWDGPPVSIVTDDPSPEGRLEALRRGPYGRCVYRCDNDVVDHQVTILRFANGVTATLTVTAFSDESTRVVRYVGSHGEIRGHLGGDIEVVPFLPAPEIVRPSGAPAPASAGGRPEGRPAPAARRIRPDHGGVRAPVGAFVGHAGGDDALMHDFLARLRSRRAGQPLRAARTSLVESLDSHLMAFAAEESRRTGRVVRPATVS